MDPRISEVEANVRATWSKADFQQAAALVFESYGRELHGFVLSQFTGERARGEDAFSNFCEDFWRALPAFEWRCTMRAWCYKLARNAAARAHKSPHERRNRRVTIADEPELAKLLVEARTNTAPYLQTEVKDAVRKLRAALSQDDRDLLTLRIDRALPWREIADVRMENPTSSEADIARFEVALRNRFTEVKKRLRRLAVDAGMI